MKTQNFKTTQEKKKVCIFSFYGYSLYNKTERTPFGGAEVQLYLLSNELAKNNGFDISIITGNYPSKRRIFSNKNAMIYVFIPLKRSIFNYIRSAVNLLSILVSIRPDVIIQRAAGIPTFFLSAYSKISKTKFIYSISSDKDVIKGAIKGFTGFLFYWGLKYASFIVAQNHTQIKLLEARQKSEIKNIYVIKNGFYVPQQKDYLKEYLLWVGRSFKEKRPELFIELAKIFPSERFMMILQKDPKVKSQDYWSRLIQDANKVPNLALLHYVPFEEINAYFKKAKVLINTSLREGFPNTFIQALMFKTPIVSLKVDPDNILKTHEIGYVCSDDFDEMEKKLKNLLENHQNYERIQNLAYKYVKKNHNIEMMAKFWKNLIKKI